MNSWGEEKVMVRKAGSGRVWEVWPPFAGSELLVLCPNLEDEKWDKREKIGRKLANLFLFG